MQTALRAFLVVPIFFALLLFAGAVYAQEANTSANTFCKPDAEWDYQVNCGEPVYDAVGNLTGKKGGKDCRCEDSTSCDNSEIIIGKCVNAGVCRATTDCEGRSVKLSPEGEKVELKPGTALSTPPLTTPQKTAPLSLSDTGVVSGWQPSTQTDLPRRSIFEQLLNPEEPSPTPPPQNKIGEFFKSFFGNQSTAPEPSPPLTDGPVAPNLGDAPAAQLQPPSEQISFEGQETPEASFVQSTFGQPQTTAAEEPGWWESKWGAVKSFFSPSETQPSSPASEEPTGAARTLPLVPNFDNYVGPNTTSEDIPIKTSGSDEKSPLEVYRGEMAQLEPKLNEMRPTLDALRGGVEKYDAEIQQFIRDKVVRIEPGKNADTYVFKPADAAEFKQLQESRNQAYESYKSVADEYKPLAEKYTNLFNGYKDLQTQDPVAAAVDSVRQSNQADQTIISNAEKQIAAAAENGNLPATDPRAYESLLKELSTRGDAALLDKSPGQVIADARARVDARDAIISTLRSLPGDEAAAAAAKMLNGNAAERAVIVQSLTDYRAGYTDNSLSAIRQIGGLEPMTSRVENALDAVAGNNGPIFNTAYAISDWLHSAADPRNADQNPLSAAFAPFTIPLALTGSAVLDPAVGLFGGTPAEQLASVNDPAWLKAADFGKNLGFTALNATIIAQPFIGATRVVAGAVGSSLNAERAVITEFRPSFAANENLLARGPAYIDEVGNVVSLRSGTRPLDAAANAERAVAEAADVQPTTRYSTSITRGEGPTLAANDNPVTSIPGAPPNSVAAYQEQYAALERQFSRLEANGASQEMLSAVSRRMQALDAQFGERVVQAANATEQSLQPLSSVGAQAARKLPEVEIPANTPLARLPANESWVPTNINTRSLFGPAEVTGVPASAAGGSSGLSLGAFGYVPSILGASFSNAFASAPPTLALPAAPPPIITSPENLSPVLTQASPAPAPIVQTTAPTAPELTAAERAVIERYGSTDGAVRNPRIQGAAPSGPITILDYIRNNFGDAAAQRARESLYQYGDPWAGLLSGGGAGGSASARASSEPPVRTPAPVPITSLPPSGITLAPPTTANPQPANQNPSQKPALSVVPTYPAWWNDIAGTPVARSASPVSNTVSAESAPVKEAPEAVLAQAAPKAALPENVTVAPRSLWQSIATVPSLVRTAVITAALSNPVVGEFLNIISPAAAKPSQITSSMPAPTANISTVLPNTTPASTAQIPNIQPQGKTVASIFGTPGDKTKGSNTMASGQKIDYTHNRGLYVVAHKTLPFGTEVLIRNPANGKTVVAQVGERGPYVAGRELDLFEVVARELGFSIRDKGVIAVEWAVIPNSARGVTPYKVGRTDLGDLSKNGPLGVTAGLTDAGTKYAAAYAPDRVIVANTAPAPVSVPPAAISAPESAPASAVTVAPPDVESARVLASNAKPPAAWGTSQPERLAMQNDAQLAQQKIQTIEDQIIQAQAQFDQSQKQLPALQTRSARLENVSGPLATARKGLGTLSNGVDTWSLFNPPSAAEKASMKAGVNATVNIKNRLAELGGADALVARLNTYIGQLNALEANPSTALGKQAVATANGLIPQVQKFVADAKTATQTSLAAANDAIKKSQTDISVLQGAQTQLAADLAQTQQKLAAAINVPQAAPKEPAPVSVEPEKAVVAAAEPAPASAPVQQVSVTAAPYAPYVPTVVAQRTFAYSMYAPSAPSPLTQARFSNAVRKPDEPQLASGSGGAQPESPLPEPTVYIVTGGTGAGKTTMADKVLPKLNPDAAIIDGESLNAADITRNVDDALAAGKVPNVVYVYRDPIEAFSANRTVPVDAFAESYVDSQQAAKALLENQALQKEGLQITLLDNSRGVGNAAPMTQEAFNKIAQPTLPELKQQLLAKTNAMFEAGTINAQEYKALTGTEAPAKVALVPAEPVVPVAAELPPTVPSAPAPTGPIEAGWLGSQVEGQVAWFTSLPERFTNAVNDNLAYVRNLIPAIPEPTYQPITPIPTSRSLVPNTAPVGPASPVTSPLAQTSPTQYVNAQGAASPEVGKVMEFYPWKMLSAPRVRGNLNNAAPPTTIELPAPAAPIPTGYGDWYALTESAPTRPPAPPILENVRPLLPQTLTPPPPTLGQVAEVPAGRTAQQQAQDIIAGIRRDATPPSVPPDYTDWYTQTQQDALFGTPPARSAELTSVENMVPVHTPEPAAPPTPARTLAPWAEIKNIFSAAGKGLVAAMRGGVPTPVTPAVPAPAVTVPAVVSEPPTLADIPEEFGGFDVSALQKNVPKAAEPAPLPAKVVEPPTLADIPDELGGHDISALQTVANGIPPAPVVPVAVAPSIWTRISNWFTGRATPAGTPTPTVTGGGGGTGGAPPPGGTPPTADPPTDASGPAAKKPSFCVSGVFKAGVCVFGGLVGIGALGDVAQIFTRSTPANNQTSDGKTSPAKTPDKTPAAPPPGKDNRVPPPDPRVTPPFVNAIPNPNGPILDRDYYCITNLNPVTVVPLNAGTRFPSNCYNSYTGNPNNNPFAALGQLLGRLFGTTQPAPTQQTSPTKPPVTPPVATSTPAKPYATLIANPSTVTAGGKSRLTWTSVNTSDCELFAPGDYLLATGTRGSTSTLPLSTTTPFVLDCRAPSGATTTASTTVTVH